MYEREFRAPIDDVWAAVTEPARLERWIGTWSGDPASGSVDFRMTAEAEDAPAETHRILALRPAPPAGDRVQPRRDDGRLAARARPRRGPAASPSSLRAAVSRTTIPVDSVGPGWDYYLDRLVAAEAGRDVAEVVWDDYYPRAGREPYRGEFS